MSDFFVKYQDRILFGSDDMVLTGGRKKPTPTRNITLYPCEDPDTLYVDTKDEAAVRKWQDRAAFDYAQFQQNTTYLGFSFDTSNVNNGSHVQLTVTLKRALPQYDIFAIISTNTNGQRHSWPVLVTPK